MLETKLHLYRKLQGCYLDVGYYLLALQMKRSLRLCQLILEQVMAVLWPLFCCYVMGNYAANGQILVKTVLHLVVL